MDKDSQESKKPEQTEQQEQESIKYLSKEEILNRLQLMIEACEGLPDFAKMSALTQYDYLSMLYLIKCILNCK